MELDGKEITAEMLTPLVQQALGKQTAVVPASGNTFHTSPIHGGWGGAIGGTALYRVTGETEEHGSWSLVLKILYEREGETAVSPYYWKREFELYRSQMLATLPPETQLTTPHIYDCVDHSNACWIWMEDIVDDGGTWSLADYRLVARRLGRFNGAYLTGHPLPDYWWLSNQWHCQIVPPLADILDHLDNYLHHPLAQRVLPLDVKDEIIGIWQEREQFIDALKSLPQTFCHIDAFRRNIFHSEAETKLIDWALAGIGAVGEELVCFVSLALYFPHMPLAQANQLDQAVFAGYIDGLRDAGWHEDARLARLGYTCAMTLRGLAGVRQDINLMLNEERHAFLRREQGHETMEEIADFFAAIRRFRLLKMAAEARRLLAEMPSLRPKLH
ncbi:MAG: phosphotransferase [Chloroflexota bacterium]